MLRKYLPKLSHHRHTGRVIHNQHTSYLPLAMVLLVVGFFLSFYTAYVAHAAHPAPQAGSIGLTGIVPSRPPTEGAVITTPTNNQHFLTSPITVAGTCPAGLLVEIYKSNIFAGSTFCTNDGKFSINIDMLYGVNVLVASVYDALNQQGPDSAPVTIYYDAAPIGGLGLANLDFGSAQLLLNTDAVYRGNFPGTEMAMPLTVLGGRAPYAINVHWGDGSSSLIPRGDNTTFNATHTYKKAGVYTVSVQATDADGRVAFITVAVIVNGQPDPVAAATTETTVGPSILIALWPLYLAIIGIITSYYLGERREKRVLEKRGLLIEGA